MPGGRFASAMRVVAWRAATLAFEHMARMHLRFAATMRGAALDCEHRMRACYATHVLKYGNDVGTK